MTQGHFLLAIFQVEKKPQSNNGVKLSLNAEKQSPMKPEYFAT